MTPLEVNLETFIAKGKFGPFDCTSTRQQISQQLGPPDAGGYPGIDTYGHVAFDWGEGEGPPCRIQILFPHRRHMRPAHPAWTKWQTPTCFETWPDARFQWKLGRFTAGITLTELLPTLEGFTEQHLAFPTDGSLRIFSAPRAGVELLFDLDVDQAALVLSSIVVHPWRNDDLVG